MKNAFLSLLKPPKFVGNEEKTRVAIILHIILLSVVASTASFTLISFFVTSNPLRYILLLTPFLLMLLGLFGLLRRGHIYWAGSGLVFVGWLIITIASATGDGIRSPGIRADSDCMYGIVLRIQPNFRLF